jgi:tape measure domain-containing protein
MPVSGGNRKAGVAFVDLAVGDSKALVEGIIRIAETSAQGFSAAFAKSFQGGGISKQVRDSIVSSSAKAADEAVNSVNARFKGSKIKVVDEDEAGRQGRKAGDKAGKGLSDELSNQAKRAGTRAGEEAGSAMGNALNSSVKRIAAGVSLGAAITGGVQSAVQFIKGATFDFNVQLTNANIAFTTMLRSAQAAQSFIGDLKQFARTTPFQFEDLVDESQRLLAMGIAAKSIIPDLTAIGDAVANLGGGKERIDRIILALGQMNAAGHVTGMELRQLTEAGIPALQILADKFGKTTGQMTQMISDGVVPADQGIAAIVEGLEHGTKNVVSFGGAMEKQSHTMAGALSNVKDALTQSLADTAKPAFDQAAKGAEGLVHWLSSPQFAVFSEQMKLGAEAVGAIVGPVVSLGSGIVSILGPLGTLVLLTSGIFGEKIAAKALAFRTSVVGAFDGFGDRVIKSAASGQRFAGTLELMRTAGSGARAGLNSLVGFLGGPWGIAITAATVGLSSIMQASASLKAAINGLQSSLNGYASLFKDGVTPATLESAKAALSNDAVLRQTVSTMSDLGVSQATLIKGLNGDQKARGEVVGALKAEIERRVHLKGLTSAQEEANLKTVDSLARMKIAFEKQNTAMQGTADLTEALAKENAAAADPLSQLATRATNYATALSNLKDKLSALTAAQDTASQAAQAIFAATVDRAEAADKASIQVTQSRVALLDHFRETQQAVAAASREAADAQLAGSRSIKSALEAERNAQLAVVNARKAALEQLKELRNQARDLGDNEESARLRLARAKAQVDATATLDPQDLDRREALLALSEAQHALDDTLTSNAKIRADLKAAETLGVEKNSDVVAANKALTDAHASAIKARTDATRANADANRKLSDAVAANSRSLDPNTKAGAANLAMVQSLADANKQKYEADLAHGVLPEVAKADYDKRAGLDKRELDNLFGKKGAADKLYDSYTAVSGNFTAVISLLGLPQASAQVDAFINDHLRPLAAFFGIDISQLNVSPPHTGSVGGKEGPGKYATGGHVRGEGTRTSDSIPAWLSDYEFIQPADAVDYYGPGFMEAIRTKSLPRELFSPLGYASGGLVGNRYVSLTNSNLFGPANAVLTDITKKLGVTGSDNKTGAVQAWLRSIAADPYVFGAVGPNAFDCSGLVGEVWARLTGHASNTRYFTTATEAGFAASHGFKPGPGAFTIGWNDHHTVGNLGGLPFEAANALAGLHIGSSATDVTSMPNVMHLGQLGGKFLGDGSVTIDPASIKLQGAMGEIIRKLVASMAAVPGSGGDYGKSTALSPVLAGWISQAEALTHTPSSWTAGLNTLIQRESGGNPNSINNWDSNAKAGDPSRGLMQTIGATFKHYHQAGTSNNIFDPVANIAAGINYIKARYGDISRVQQANPHLPPKGYRDGGWLNPGDTGVSEPDLRKPEAILTNDQWANVGTLAARGAESGGMTHVTVRIGNEEFKGYIETVVEERADATHQGLARKLRGR